MDIRSPAKSNIVKFPSAGRAAKRITCGAFLKKYFEKRTTGNAFFCSFANPDADETEFSVRSLTTRDWKKAEAFLKKYDVPGRGVYFAGSTVIDRKRGKDHVAANDRMIGR